MMIERSRMDHLLIGIAISCFLGKLMAEGHDVLTPGSCSRKCKMDNNTETQYSIDYIYNSQDCSCTSSCVMYQDCCYDSEHYITGYIPNMKPPTMCLSLKGKRAVSAISGCANHWTGTWDFCTKAIGFLPPVTSKISGHTYANIYCAICNKDEEDLMMWKTELRCCPEHDDIPGNELEFKYSNGHLWSVWRFDNLLCRCEYVSRDTSFADSLELRSCQNHPEVSKCSFSWKNDTTRELCAAFLDPVYLYGKMYRNIYCAECNYEKLEHARCPTTSERQSYFHGRGRSYALSDLFRVNIKKCLPPKNRRCCKGERYDRRTRQCRTVKNKHFFQRYSY